ncbi:MAG: hypothetical protein ABI700_26615, partial [Chloroflexota bacterium]
TIMPLMYGFFALSFSIGLSLYFIASNTIGIVQYALMGKADFKRIFGFGAKTAPAVINSKSNTTNTPALRKVEGTGSNKSDSPKRSNNGKDKTAPKADKAK